MEKCQYDELKAQQNVHWWFVGKREIVIDFAQTHAGLKEDPKNQILDVGCGMGLMLNVLAQYGRIYGVDMEQEAVDYCNECLKEDHIDGQVVLGSLPNAIPFQDGFFDYIFALDIIEHVEDDIGALNALRNMLKPNGKLIITVPALMSMWSYNDELNHHFRRYEKDELIRKVRDAGLSIIKCSFYNSYLFFPAWLVRKVKNLLHVQSSDVTESSKDGFINGLFKKIFVSEKYRLRIGEFKKGVSLIMVCE